MKYHWVIGIHTSEGMVNVDLPVRLCNPSECRVMPHVRRIRALGERERRVVIGHLQETIDQTGWEVHEGLGELCTVVYYTNQGEN
jgi:hypothetical protein